MHIRMFKEDKECILWGNIIYFQQFRNNYNVQIHTWKSTITWLYKQHPPKLSHGPWPLMCITRQENQGPAFKSSHPATRWRGMLCRTVISGSWQVYYWWLIMSECHCNGSSTLPKSDQSGLWLNSRGIEQLSFC